MFCHLYNKNIICKMLRNRCISTFQARREKILHRRRLLLFYVFLQVNHISREIWVHPLNEDRASKGEFFNLYCDQRYFGDRFFLNYRMSVHQFDDILRKITPYIKKKDTNFRSSISAEEKLCLTIRYVDLFCILLPLINKQTNRCDTLAMLSMTSNILVYGFLHIIDGILCTKS